MSDISAFTAAPTNRHAAQSGDGRPSFVSPYLDQPARSFEQAVSDAMQLRCRVILAAMLRGVMASARPA